MWNYFLVPMKVFLYQTIIVFTLSVVGKKCLDFALKQRIRNIVETPTLGAKSITPPLFNG